MKRPWRPDLIVIRDYLTVLSRPGAEYTMRGLETAVSQTGRYHRQYLIHLKRQRWISIRREDNGKVPVRVTAEGRRSLEEVLRFSHAFYGPSLFADMPAPGVRTHRIPDDAPEITDEELFADE